MFLTVCNNFDFTKVQKMLEYNRVAKSSTVFTYYQFTVQSGREMK
jgi:hypothetical protein